MGAASVALAGQPPRLPEVYTCRCRSLELHSVPRSSRGRISVAGIKRGSVAPRLCSSDAGRAGWKGVRRGVVRAQGEEKETRELDKVEDKPPGSWTSSVRRTNAVSRIFVATFVWISLFFGMSVANNEIGGGRPGRRGPRK